MGRRVLYLLGAAMCLTPWASPPLALTVGMILALLIDNPYQKLGKTVSKRLLQASVVLLGFSMDLGVVLRAGERGILFAAATIAAAFLLGALIGRWLGIGRRVSTLISAGTAICGGSAIAAVGSVVGALESEMTVAIGTVFILNAIALYIFPPIGHALHLTQGQFGTWAGVAIHDISSVVGAGSRYGLDALQTATAVKLSRALWIVPVALGAAWAFRNAVESEAAQRRGKLPVPWFIGLFLLASMARTWLPPVAQFSPQLSTAARLGMTLTLFLIGAGLSVKTLKAVGWKPLAQGVQLWIFLSVASLLVVLWTVH